MANNISGHRIRIARSMQKPPITQKDLAARMQVEGLNIVDVTISSIELGDRSVSDLELVTFAKVLNVTTSWLLEETDNPR